MKKTEQRSNHDGKKEKKHQKAEVVIRCYHK